MDPVDDFEYTEVVIGEGVVTEMYEVFARHLSGRMKGKEVPLGDIAGALKISFTLFAGNLLTITEKQETVTAVVHSLLRSLHQKLDPDNPDEMVALAAIAYAARHIIEGGDDGT